MKATQLISALIATVDKYGDLDVYVMYAGSCGWADGYFDRTEVTSFDIVSRDLDGERLVMPVIMLNDDALEIYEGEQK